MGSTKLPIARSASAAAATLDPAASFGAPLPRRRDRLVFRFIAHAFRSHPILTTTCEVILVLAAWIALLCIPLSTTPATGSGIDLNAPPIEKPPDIPDAQWDELQHRPAQLSWPRFIFAYYPLYNASTAATVATLLVQYAQAHWPRDWLDFAMFTVPMIVIPVLLNACAHSSCLPHAPPPVPPPPVMATNKIWLSILTVTAVAYGMLYVLARNYIDRRRWLRNEKLAMATLRKRLSILNNVLINGFRTVYIIFAKLLLMLIASKAKSPHTLYACEFYVDMLYWVMYRNMFSANHSSPWTIPLFSLTHGLQRVIWIRIKFSESYHRFLSELPANLAAGWRRWADALLVPQHQPSNVSSTATFVDPFDTEVTGAGYEGEEGPDVEEQGPARVASVGMILRSAVITTNNGPAEHSKIMKRTRLSSSTSTSNLSPSFSTSQYTYSSYLAAQSIYESHELLAQLLTILSFILSLLLLPTFPNSTPAYPTLTYLLDAQRRTTLLIETLATLAAEAVAALCGHYLLALSLFNN
ncbi:hypothetical protein HDU86_000947 [Geranomyces michiganensis]|nr:hypothetical protein HDU86_000947 [Geranomyces michiganensis]